MENAKYSRKGLNRYPIRTTPLQPSPDSSNEARRNSRSEILPKLEPSRASTGTTSPVDSLLAQDNVEEPRDQTSSAWFANEQRDAIGQPSYVGAQLAEPCVAGALCHILKPCGHKIMTLAPEECAINCEATNDQSIATNKPFACPACISALLLAHKSQKRSAFLLNIRAIERIFGTLEQKWFDKRFIPLKDMWRRDMEIERNNLEGLGRRCFDFSKGVEGADSMAASCTSPGAARHSFDGGPEFHGSFVPSACPPTFSELWPSGANVSRLPIPSKGSQKQKGASGNETA